jgi:hypothetical protein
MISQHPIQLLMTNLFQEIAASISPLPTDSDPIGEALTAVGYRSIAAKEFSKDFGRSVGGSPCEEEKYLFAFVGSALSSLECFCFSMYFIGAHMDRQNFPLVGKMKDINIKATAAAFQQAYPNDSLTQLLAQITPAPEFIRLSDLRNVLMHRLAPQRWRVFPLPESGEVPRTILDIYAEGSQSGVNPSAPEMSGKLTQDILAWVELTLSQLAEAATLFISAHSQ